MSLSSPGTKEVDKDDDSLSRVFGTRSKVQVRRLLRWKRNAQNAFQFRSQSIVVTCYWQFPSVPVPRLCFRRLDVSGVAR